MIFLAVLSTFTYNIECEITTLLYHKRKEKKELDHHVHYYVMLFYNDSFSFIIALITELW